MSCTSEPTAGGGHDGVLGEVEDRQCPVRDAHLGDAREATRSARRHQGRRGKALSGLITADTGNVPVGLAAPTRGPTNVSKPPIRRTSKRQTICFRTP